MLPAGLPWVLADARRIRQVLRNLIENAVKYSPNGGTIAVAVKFHSPSRTVQVSVADEGIGIAPEHQTRLFDRFYQVDSASTRKVGGTGLGLSICRAIIDAHQGQIWVLSQPGSGSVFYFTLPTLPQPDSLDLETSLEESDFEE